MCVESAVFIVAHVGGTCAGRSNYSLCKAADAIDWRESRSRQKVAAPGEWGG